MAGGAGFKKQVRPVGRQPDQDYVEEKADGVADSTSTPLAADETYESDWIDTDGFRSIEVFVSADEVSAPGGVEFQYTDDVKADSPTVRKTVSKRFNQDNVDDGAATYYFSPRIDGFRVRYTNGSSAQNEFFLSVTLRARVAEKAQETLISDLESEIQALVTRSVLAGEDDDDKFNNVHAEAMEETFTTLTGVHGLLTYGDRALQTHAQDQLRVDVENENAGLATESTLSSVHSELQDYSTISTGNSTEQTLSASETWTGEWESVDEYAAILILGATTADSATDGVQAQFSFDGNEPDRVVAETIAATQTGVFFAFPPEAEFFRLVYTNGGDSNDIEVETVYHHTPTQSHQRALGSTIDGNNVASVTKAVLAGEDTSGDFQNVGLTNDADLHVSVESHAVDTPLKPAGGFSTNQANVDSTAVQIATNPPTGRVTVSVKALSGNDASVYIGPTSSVGTNTGWELSAGESVVLELDENQSVHAIADSDGQRVAWMHVNE